jgi:hypothetical protein
MIESQLIFSFFKHPAFGLSMDAYLVELLENKSFSYQYKRVVFELIENYDYTFSETDRKILKKIGELNPKNIEKQFNKYFHSLKLAEDIISNYLSNKLNRNTNSEIKHTQDSVNEHHRKMLEYIRQTKAELLKKVFENNKEIKNKK